MPARSRAQKIAIIIAEKHPNKLKDSNKSLLAMSPQQMKEFTSTPTKGLPYRVKSPSAPKSIKPKTRKFYGQK
jgi:hypothetical protein